LGEHNISKDIDCQRFGKKILCNDPPEDFGILKKIAHPEYSRSLLSNDVGLIKLDREVFFTGTS